MGRTFKEAMIRHSLPGTGKTRWRGEIEPRLLTQRWSARILSAYLPALCVHQDDREELHKMTASIPVSLP